MHLRLFSVVLSLVLSTIGRAHDPGLSSSTVKIGADSTIIEVLFSNRDVAACLAGVDADGDGTIDTQELQSGRAAIERFALMGVIVSEADRPLTVTVRSIVLAGDDEDVALSLTSPLPTGDQLQLALPALEELPRGHRHFTAVMSGESALATALLYDDRRAVALDMRNAAPAGAFELAGGFLVLGVEHILIGFDHVLFLLALLMASASLGAAFSLITAFTAAHSLTLIAATLDLIAMPASIVEPIIALSIVWVAIASLCRKTVGHRWGLVFAFGLVHGLGFASVLRGLGIADTSGLLPLLSFNLGVEVGQVAIAAVAIPILTTLRRKAWFMRYGMPGVYLAVAVCGAFWFGERAIWG